MKEIPIGDITVVHNFKANCLDVCDGESERPCGCQQGCQQGCHNHDRRWFVDYTGQTVNDTLLIRKEVDRTEAGLIVWEAVCLYKDCGNVFRLSSECIKKGTCSCGCKASETTRIRHLEKYKE